MESGSVTTVTGATDVLVAGIKEVVLGAVCVVSGVVLIIILDVEGFCVVVVIVVVDVVSVVDDVVVVDVVVVEDAGKGTILNC